LSKAFKAFFLLGSVAAAIFALILAILFLSIFMLTLINLALAFLTAVYAFLILARIAAFLASGAFLRAFLRASNFLIALSIAFNAFFFSGDFVLASYLLIC